MRDWNLKRTFVIVHKVTHLISHQEELGNLTLGKIIIIPPSQYFHRRLAVCGKYIDWSIFFPAYRKCQYYQQNRHSDIHDIPYVPTQRYLHQRLEQ